MDKKIYMQDQSRWFILTAALAILIGWFANYIFEGNIYYLVIFLALFIFSIHFITNPSSQKMKGGKDNGIQKEKASQEKGD